MVSRLLPGISLTASNRYVNANFNDLWRLSAEEARVKDQSAARLCLLGLQEETCGREWICLEPKDKVL